MPTRRKKAPKKVSRFERDIKAAEKESRAGKGVPYRWGILR